MSFVIFVPILVIGEHIINERHFALFLFPNFAKINNHKNVHNAHASVIYLSVDSLYIVWHGQLLCICGWSVWRHLGTDMRIVPMPFFVCRTSVYWEQDT